jgi:hypothetical protein
VRHADGSYDDVDHLDRCWDPDLFWDRRVEGDPWLSGLTSVCDLELGIRASEQLDLLEDESDVMGRAQLARHLAALHVGFGYVGSGHYACRCGHVLNEDAPSTFPLREGQRGSIADLKAAHLLHRLEVEPWALGRG